MIYQQRSEECQKSKISVTIRDWLKRGADVVQMLESRRASFFIFVIALRQKVLIAEIKLILVAILFFQQCHKY